MEVFKGSATFSGIAIGKIMYYQKEEYQIRQCLINNVKNELESFEKAQQQVISQLKALYDENYPMHERELQSCAEQIKLLSGGSFQRAIVSMISSEKVNAAYAVTTTRDEIASTFRNLEEISIKRRIENIKEISNRLVAALGGLTSRIDLGEEPVILASEVLSPTELMEMDKDKLLAVVTHQGSAISHTAIVTKTMDIPSLIEIEIDPEWNGRNAIVDGYTGTLYLDPDEDIRQEYMNRQKIDQEEREALLKLRDKKDTTADGREVFLFANIGNLDDLNSVTYYGAGGIGLLRSEFQYLGRENYPRENELFRAYKKVAETMGDRIAVIRTFDLGADKQAEYLGIPEEVNPIMGNRGIRLSLDRRKMFKAQLRAIYRASAYGNLGIMYPMITSEEEVDEIEKITDEVKKGLDEKGIPYRNILTGIMVETPAAVMMSRELAKKVDFLSIGTNDLSQYVLAMDRQNPLLKNKYNDHHPAILRMIRMIVKAAHDEGRHVCLCGELAADVNLTETFLRMGMDALSVAPICILPVRRAIREARAYEE
ncbi:MAG: phosphoenolpyruvate--protein phosphotransferase [Blautia sp.]|nr:phosphoenolpyruvate--protein phosphotransferase [Blautia sp.]